MNLIRTPRHWLPQLIDIILTVIAWLFFLWLLFGSVTEIIVDENRGPKTELSVDAPSGVDSLILYLVLSLLMAVILIGWAAYRRRQANGYERRARVPDLSREALSRNFGVEATLMKKLQSHRLMILHNDTQGNLNSVEFVEKDGSPVGIEGNVLSEQEDPIEGART